MLPAVIPLLTDAVPLGAEDLVTRAAGKGIGTAILLGPGAGHWYAGNGAAAWRGVGIRFLATVLGTAAFASLLVD